MTLAVEWDVKTKNKSKFKSEGESTPLPRDPKIGIGEIFLEIFWSPRADVDDLRGQLRQEVGLFSLCIILKIIIGFII